MACLKYFNEMPCSGIFPTPKIAMKVIPRNSVLIGHASKPP
jgi:hypothetical protein